MKRLIIAAVALFVSVAAFAQAGIIGGFTSSSMDIKEVDMSKVAGYHIGFAYRTELPSGLGIQPQITYNVKGSDWEDVKSTLGFLELGAQLQYGLDLIALKPFVFAEPFVGYAITGESDLTGYDFKKIENKLEYGVAAGAGVTVLGCIQICAKYFWNFDDCDLNNYMSSVKETLDNPKSFNGLAISAAFFF
ncbi:MAG: PorT family protein [Bacteroidales bacterium]|nr:PorT family protein [Bacteroidales bacterium]